MRMIVRTLRCEWCEKEWQYVRAKAGGRDPAMCLSCRSLPEVLRHTKIARESERKARARERVDKLEAALAERRKRASGPTS